MGQSVSVRVLCGDALDQLATLPDESVHCAVTSPPYFGLRDYGMSGQIGLEPAPDEYVTKLVAVFREVRRVLRNDGTLWLNIGDSYNNFRSQMGPGQAVHGRQNLNGKPGIDSKSRGVKGLKEKDLIGIPWLLAFALRADGWYLRQDIIWHKPNPMPESVTDRCTKAHEYVFLLSKSPRYYFDSESIREPTVYAGKQLSQKRGEFVGKGGPAGREPFRAVREMRNRRSVWTVASSPYAGAHFATFPPTLVHPCISAGCPPNGTVLDPFAGSGTTLQVALELGRQAIGIELNPEYCALIHHRLYGSRPVQRKRLKIRHRSFNASTHSE